jgi:hypothetical protein
VKVRSARRPKQLSEHRIDRWVSDIEHGRFERSLSAMTAFAATVTTAEIYVEHYRASFGNKWSRIIVTPPVMIADIGGVFSRKWVKTYRRVASRISPISRPSVPERARAYLRIVAILHASVPAPLSANRRDRNVAWESAGPRAPRSLKRSPWSHKELLDYG